MTRCALVTGVQTCALPIASDISDDVNPDTITLNASTTTALASLGLATNLSDSLSVAQKDPIGFSYGADGKGVTGGISFDDSAGVDSRSEEHTSDLQSLMRISYAVFCLTKNIAAQPN